MLAEILRMNFTGNLRYSGLKTDIEYRFGKTAENIIGTFLNTLERTGGENAFINIKYIIPTYESCTGAR